MPAALRDAVALTAQLVACSWLRVSGILNFPNHFPSLFQGDGKPICTEGLSDVPVGLDDLLWCTICNDAEDAEDCENCGCRVRSTRCGRPSPPVLLRGVHFTAVVLRRAVQICFSKLRSDTLLVCDMCETEWHMMCLDPPLFEVRVSVCLAVACPSHHVHCHRAAGVASGTCRYPLDSGSARCVVPIPTRRG